MEGDRLWSRCRVCASNLQYWYQAQVRRPRQKMNSQQAPCSQARIHLRIHLPGVEEALDLWMLWLGLMTDSFRNGDGGRVCR